MRSGRITGLLASLLLACAGRGTGPNACCEAATRDAHTPPVAAAAGHSEKAAASSADHGPAHAPQLGRGSNDAILDAGTRPDLPEQLRSAAGSSSVGALRFDGSRASALGPIDVRSCKRPGGPTGAGHVTMTFAGSGEPSAVVLDGGSFAGTTTGECVLERFRAVRAAPFDGGTVKLGKSFVVD